jgi:geranylgeranyl diphosphate synthase type I
VNRWGDDVIDRMLPFVGSGKMLRGCLVAKTAAMLGRPLDEGVLAMASAIEVMHASLLVHDDVMDNDRLRRGLPTIFAQYEESSAGRAARDGAAFGHAMATCFGDLGFFMSWQLIARTGGMSVELTDLFGREMAAVCLAQMEDVAAGMTVAELTEAEIEAIYRFKTARYTFALPLMCGARLAGRPPEQLLSLERVGETLGLMFQLKDDELGLFGDPEQTGKPAGSDIAENKKTLLRLWLLQRSDGTQRGRLEAAFGNAALSSTTIDGVRAIATDLDLPREIDSRLAQWAEEAQLLIGTLPLEPIDVAWLYELVEFNQKRTK